MSDRSNTTVLLGHVSAAHGIRGEVVIKSYTDDPAAIASYGPLSDEDGGRTFTLSHVRVTKKGVIARIAGITDRNDAETLRDTKLYIARDKLPVPEAGEIYHADLIGLTARRRDDTVVGEIVAIQNFGAGDLLEIRLKDSRRTEFVPFTQDFVPELDVVCGYVTVIMPDDTASEDTVDVDADDDYGDSGGEDSKPPQN